MNKALRFLVAVLALGSTTGVIAAEYEFSRVFSGWPVYPGVAINDNGLVALIHQVAATSSGALITTDGMTVTNIAGPWPAAQNYLSSDYGQTLSLNNSGFVAFRGGAYLGASGILASNGTTTYTIATTIAHGGSVYSFPDAAMSINDSGTVAFSANPTSTSDSKVYCGNGSGNPTQISGREGLVPSLNNAGAIAYRHYDSVTSKCTMELPVPGALFAFPDAPFGNMVAPDINNLGTVAYITMVDGVQKIAIGNGLSASTYIDGSLYAGGLTGGYWNDGAVADCAINDQGVVAFMASPVTAGTSGIFIGPDPVSDKVVMVGDMLDGASVVQLQFARNGLNNRGQIAFQGRLSDGTYGVWVATPVPEPSSLVLLGMGVLGLTGSLWRRRSAVLRCYR